MKSYIAHLILIASVITGTMTLPARPAKAGDLTPEAWRISLSKLMTKQYTAAIKCAQATEAGKFPMLDICWTPKYSTKCHAAFQKWLDKALSGNVTVALITAAAANDMTKPPYNGCDGTVQFLSSGAPNPVVSAWEAFGSY